MDRASIINTFVGSCVKYSDGLTLLVIEPTECFAFLLFCTIAKVFQIYLGSDMMYEMKRRKPEPTLLPIQGTFNLPHHIGMA